MARKLSKAGYSLGDVHYKTVPRGMDADHPRAELMRHNALYAYKSFPVPDSFYTGEFVAFCEQHFDAMAPMHDWCVKLLKRAH